MRPFTAMVYLVSPVNFTLPQFPRCFWIEVFSPVKTKLLTAALGRSSCLEVCYKNDVLRVFSKFTGKHLCQSLFSIKLQAKTCNFIKNETLAKVFFCEFCKTSKNTFFTEHLRWLLLPWTGCF